MTDIDLKNVALSFGHGASARQILTGIDLHIRSGEFVSIIGPSGCGKTTLLRMIAGLVAPTWGKITTNGVEITKPARTRAIVFQDYGKALLPWRRVWANVALAFEDEGGSEATRRTRAIELLRTMRLDKFADHFPRQLSGGMQQRVQIARTLGQNPQIWLMDEPFGALDAITRQQLQDEVASIARERNITVIFITHDLEEAIYLGDRVIVLGAHPGRIVENIEIDLPYPRNQLTTREDPRFLSHRHRLFGLLQDH